MQELITKIDEYIHHTNDLTREMDTYLHHIYPHMNTYIYDHSLTGESWSIRYPGATRGCILIDKNNIITDIILNNDGYTEKIYKQEVKDCFKKFIGMKFVLVK